MPQMRDHNSVSIGHRLSVEASQVANMWLAILRPVSQLLLRDTDMHGKRDGGTESLHEIHVRFETTDVGVFCFAY